ncbi:MAG: DMT family transporter [Dermatophilaceae bacterium]
MSTPRSLSTSVLAQFVLLALTWGASFLFIKVALGGLSPFQVTFGRLLIGAVTLAAICAWSRRALPRDPRVWAHLLVVALLLCALPFTLFAWAEQHISSALASIYNATTPLMTMLVAVSALPEERPTRARLVGLATGFLGVLVILAPWSSLGDSDLTGQLACLAATSCYGVAFVYLRRTITPRGLHAVPVATVQVGLGAAVMTIAAPWLASDPVQFSRPVVGSIIALGALGTGLAYVWNTAVVNSWGATNAATVTYLTPVVGVALGALALGERISWHEPVGALVVICGIAITQERLHLPTTRRWRRPSEPSPIDDHVT